MSRTSFEDLDLSTDEIDRLTNAFKKDDFKKLFFEYCEEIQDPENRKKYEADIIQLEAERGVEVTFLHPKPGFVTKTSVDGKTKCFINITSCDKIECPTKEFHRDEATDKVNLSWRIPLAQSPPRNDIDKKNNKCIVYDVLFNPLALQYAKNTKGFKCILVQTALDAIEREFKVTLDKNNVKFPKITYKGLARPIVKRKAMESMPDIEPSPIDQYYPPMPTEGNTKPKNMKTSQVNKKKEESFTTPSFLIKHRKNVDISELTNDIDAKMNATLPKELVIEIHLPLLNSTNDCTLDVTARKLYLISERPAKYKLSIDLPFNVHDQDGSAKFDCNQRKLTVLLPVIQEDSRIVHDLYREDSGVESDVKDECGSFNETNLVQVISTELNDKQPEEKIIFDTKIENKFLNDDIKYNFPTHFDCNTLNENLAFTLHIKNVDSNSIEFRHSTNFVHLKFTTIGSGYYPVHYSFYMKFLDESDAKIEHVDTEVWDNNVIITLILKNFENLKKYSAGLNEDNLKDYNITEEFTMSSKKFTESKDQVSFDVSVKPVANGNMEIEISPFKPSDLNNRDIPNQNNNKKPHFTKKQLKKLKNKKQRSLSESSCNTNTNLCSDNKRNENNLHLIKTRSLSESRSNDDMSSSGSKDFKGILKHRSRYDNLFESSSSIDDAWLSRSLDHSINISVESEKSGLSESCKKTVRFNDVIRKQIFRMDSSILGQRKKNYKRKCQKQKAYQRRNSEGDSFEFETKMKTDKKLGNDEACNSEDQGSKTSLIFDLEM